MKNSAALRCERSSYEGLEEVCSERTLHVGLEMSPPLSSSYSRAVARLAALPVHGRQLVSASVIGPSLLGNPLLIPLRLRHYSVIFTWVARFLITALMSSLLHAIHMLPSACSSLILISAMGYPLSGTHFHRGS